MKPPREGVFISVKQDFYPADGGLVLIYHLGHGGCMKRTFFPLLGLILIIALCLPVAVRRLWVAGTGSYGLRDTRRLLEQFQSAGGCR